MSSCLKPSIMSLSYTCARCCARTAFRSSPKPFPSAAAVAALRQHNTPLTPPTHQQRRWESTASLNPKISSIVDQISQLTLLETADLVSSLKVLFIFPPQHSPPPPTNNSSQKKAQLTNWVSSLTKKSLALTSPTCPWVDFPSPRRPRRPRRWK